MKNPNQIQENDSRGIPASQERKVRATRAVGAGITAKLQPGWNEVAMIDFTGYTDADCEERIIYKTPDGRLKAARHSTGQAEVIEDVTREQVTRWLAQCVIPEEFEKDFAPYELDEQDAQALLEEAITTSAALLHALAELLRQGISSGNLELNLGAVRGLHILAREQGDNLDSCFEGLRNAQRNSKGGAK